MKTVVLLSGGIDSATALAARLLFTQGGPVDYALAINYGQRAQLRELVAADAVASHFGVELHRSVIDVPAWKGESFPMSENASIDRSYIAHRNLILVACAAVWAARSQVDHIVVGWHMDDPSSGFPDTSPAFREAAERALSIGGPRPTYIVAPLIGVPKVGVVRLAEAYGVPLASTYSCYAGGAVHCGRCQACVGRKRAFEASGVPDPTTYKE